jgi:hypothetical protein
MVAFAGQDENDFLAVRMDVTIVFFSRFNIDHPKCHFRIGVNLLAAQPLDLSRLSPGCYRKRPT